MKNLLQFCFIYYKIEEVTDRRVLEKGFRACRCEQENSNALFAQLARVFWQVAFGIAQPAFYLVELS